MTTTSTYIKIKETYPPMNRCFFAFNEQQFSEGKTQSGIMSGEMIYSAGAGLYGTKILPVSYTGQGRMFPCK